MLLWVENTISEDFPASTPALGCSARTAPCWLLHPAPAWRRTGAGASSRDIRLWLVAVVAGRQRHSAQCFSQGHLSHSSGRGSSSINGCGFVAGLVCTFWPWFFFSSFVSCQLSQQAHNNPTASPQGHSCWLKKLSCPTGTKENLPTALSGQAAPPTLLALFHQGKHLPGPPGTAGP